MTLVEKLINEHNLAVQYAEESPKKDGFLSGMKKAIDIVKNHNGWISVDDELPEPIDTNVEFRNQQNKVQIYYRDIYGNLFVDYAWYVLCYDDCETYAKWELCNDKEFIEVLCWQYLPEPPKE